MRKGGKRPVRTRALSTTDGSKKEGVPREVSCGAEPRTCTPISGVFAIPATHTYQFRGWRGPYRVRPNSPPGGKDVGLTPLSKTHLPALQPRPAPPAPPGPPPPPPSPPGPLSARTPACLTTRRQPLRRTRTRSRPALMRKQRRRGPRRAGGQGWQWRPSRASPGRRGRPCTRLSPSSCASLPPPPFWRPPPARRPPGGPPTRQSPKHAPRLPARAWRNPPSRPRPPLLRGGG